MADKPDNYTDVGRTVQFVDASDDDTNGQLSQISPSKLKDQLDETIKPGDKQNRNKSLFERTEDFLRGVQKKR